MTSSAPSCEVCVVTYESEATISALIKSLAPLKESMGLAVHENSGQVRTLHLAQDLAEAAGVTFRGEMCPAGNCGFALGCNSLAQRSERDILIFLNPDAYTRVWPHNLSNAANEVRGAAIHDTSGRQRFSYGTSRTIWDEIKLRWLRKAPREPIGRGYVSGAALMVGRARFLELGGFDPSYFMYYEDIDFCARANEAGVSVRLDRDWHVVHVGGSSVAGRRDGARIAAVVSYRSGKRFHAQRSKARMYDAVCLIDAAARCLLFSMWPTRRSQVGPQVAVIREIIAGPSEIDPT